MTPFAAQIEQLSNAYTLATDDRATIINDLNSYEAVNHWLNTEVKYEPVHYQNTAKHIAQWINEGAEENIQQLSKRLWQLVER